ncbi:MAG: alpha/beta fold hydrolase [Actinobacteria bacterium]|nr:MAG: alpha/beta fold hydrolase [Actinomycetota bacterium]
MTDATAIPGFEEHFAEAKGCRLRYFVGGPPSGAPLVLVHGLGGCAANWVDTAPLLAARRRVLVPELPGHGGSTPLPAVPNLAVFADRVAAVAEREGMLPAAFVGHSLGGVVALRLALRRRNDVSALVLAAGAGISSTTRRAKYGLRILGIIGPRRLVAPWADSVADSPLLRYAVFGRWGAADPLILSRRAVDGFLEGTRLTSDSVSAARAVVSDDVRQELGELACPALVLWGARDNQLRLADGFEFARRLGAPLRVIADCGHLLIGERPDLCAEAIENFLG